MVRRVQSLRDNEAFFFRREKSKSQGVSNATWTMYWDDIGHDETQSIRVRYCLSAWKWSSFWGVQSGQQGRRSHAEDCIVE